MSKDTDYRKFTMTIASGVTTSNEVDIGGNYNHVYLQVPASSVGNTRMFMANTLNGTSLRVANAAGTPHDIASSVSNVYVRVNDHGRYNTVCASTAPANGGIYTLVCFS
jgi:hypothetical protein